MAGPRSCDQEQVDSFCTLYTKMVNEKADATAAKKLPSGMKERLLLNETLYRNSCPQAKA